MSKTLTFGLMHLCTAFNLSYALTGSVAIAGAITFIEPLVNTVLHYFFDKYWDHPAFERWRQRWGPRKVACNPGLQGMDGPGAQA